MKRSWFLILVAAFAQTYRSSRFCRAVGLTGDRRSLKIHALDSWKVKDR